MKLIGLEGRANQRFGQLSLGEKQWLEILMLVVQEPGLLMLDEPAEGIQPNIVDLIEDAVSKLPARGIAVLLVEQFVDFAVGVCNHFYMMERGTVVAQGPTSALGQEMIDEYLAV